MLRKKDNPAVPVTPDEQIESTHAAYEAGSALVHIHVRDKDENPSSSPELFARFMSRMPNWSSSTSLYSGSNNSDHWLVNNCP